MADISAQDVAALRKATGAGMMDCKQALESSDGDLDTAMDWLRAKGLGKAGKLGEREANEGAVEALVDGNVGVIVEVNCNTDFVAKGADFTGVVAELAKLAVQEGKEELAEIAFEGGTVGEHITQLAAKLGENVALGRVIVYESTDGLIDGYRHNQNERGVIGVLLELGGVDPSDAKAQEVAHDIALHIASAAPQYLTREEVSPEVIERERAVFEELTRNEGKPENAIEKIVEGRLNGFYKENVLLEQGFIKEPKTTIGQLVAGLGSDATVRRFARVKIGEA